MEKVRRFPRLIGSGESREKHSGVALVFGEAGTKFLTEKRFLAAGFDVKGEPSDGHEEEGAHFADGDTRSQKAEQNSGVNRMANRAIGAGSNQFVTHFEGNRAAPIGAEMPSRPERHSNSGRGQQNAHP